MSTARTTFPIQREPELAGQTVVMIGGSAGIGLETARRAAAISFAPRFPSGVSWDRQTSPHSRYTS